MTPRRRASSDPAQPSPVPQEAMEKHAGRWVALKGGKVIADAEDAKELLARPDVDADATPFYVPDQDELF